MAKNTEHIQHIKSSQVLENGKPKLPQASSLAEGELAINFAKGVETISLKNSSGDVVTFSSDNYYTEQKLGSGFTGSNSAKTVTEVIEASKEVEISSGVTPTGDTIVLWVDESEDPAEHDVYTKADIDNKLGSGFTPSSITDVIIENEEIVSAALTDLDERKLDVSAYTPTDLSNYYTKSETSGATEISNALSGKVNTSDIISAITPSNSGSTAPIATKVVAENELTVSNALNDLEENKQNILSAGAGIDITNDVISVTGSIITVDQVIDSGTSASTNAVSTKAVVDILIEDEEIISTALADLDERKLDASAYTPTDLSNYYTKSETSGATEISTALNLKANASDFNTHTGNTSIHHTHDNKSALDAITGSVGTMAYQAASSYSSATQVNTALGNKAETTALTQVNNTLTAHTADTTIHVTAADKEKLHTHSNKTALDSITGNVGTMAYENKTSYSSATEVNTALGNKANASDFNTHTGNTSIHHTHSNKSALDAITGSVGTMAYQNTNSYSSATEVNTALGGKANTATTLAGYGITDAYTKSETSGATELTNALNNKADSAITFTAGTGLSGGGDLSSNRTFSLAMPTTYSAETYTSSTITSSEPIVYALVSYSGTTALNNQVCPVSGLADGQQCNIIYHSANNNAYDAVISTNYVEPDGQEITLKIPAGGYAEINYINIKGTIFVRGI